MIDSGVAKKGTVLITGGASGIGLASALHLADLGFEVFATYLDEEERRRADAMAGGRVRFLFMDLAWPETIHAAVQEVASELNGVGVAGLVNNAGLDIPGPLEFLPLEELRRQFEINVFGQVAVTQALLPLIRQAGGRIIFIGSIDGKSVTPFQGAYGASKHAIEAITDIFRMELSPWDISVSVVEPGDIATPIWQKSMALADDLRRRLPQRANELYGNLMDKALSLAKKMAGRAKPPETVARAVGRAMTARRVRPRYMVGLDARIRYALDILPARWVDRIILGVMRKG